MTINLTPIKKTTPFDVGAFADNLDAAQTEVILANKIIEEAEIAINNGKFIKLDEILKENIHQITEPDIKHLIFHTVKEEKPAMAMDILSLTHSKISASMFNEMLQEAMDKLNEQDAEDNHFKQISKASLINLIIKSGKEKIDHIALQEVFATAVNTPGMLDKLCKYDQIFIANSPNIKFVDSKHISQIFEKALANEDLSITSYIAKHMPSKIDHTAASKLIINFLKTGFGSNLFTMNLNMKSVTSSAPTRGSDIIVLEMLKDTFFRKHLHSIDDYIFQQFSKINDGYAYLDSHYSKTFARAYKFQKKLNDKLNDIDFLKSIMSDEDANELKAKHDQYLKMREERPVTFKILEEIDIAINDSAAIEEIIFTKLSAISDAEVGAIFFQIMEKIQNDSTHKLSEVAEEILKSVPDKIPTSILNELLLNIVTNNLEINNYILEKMLRLVEPDTQAMVLEIAAKNTDNKFYKKMISYFSNWEKLDNKSISKIFETAFLHQNHDCITNLVRHASSKVDKLALTHYFINILKDAIKPIDDNPVALISLIVDLDIFQKTIELDTDVFVLEILTDPMLQQYMHAVDLFRFSLNTWGQNKSGIIKGWDEIQKTIDKLFIENIDFIKSIMSEKEIQQVKQLMSNEKIRPSGLDEYTSIRYGKKHLSTPPMIKSYKYNDQKIALSQEGITGEYCYELKAVRLRHVDLLKTMNDNQEKEVKIPHNLHYVWMSDLEGSTELQEKYKSVMEKTVKALRSGDNDWEVTLWSNVNIDERVKTSSFLKSIGAKFAHISELKSFEKFKNNIAEAVSNREFAKASDIVRAIAVNEKGGGYFDLDYSLLKSIDNLTYTFDSFFTVEGANQQLIANAVFFSKANGPVISKFVEFIDRNLNQEQKPSYVKYPENMFTKTIFSTGPMTFTSAFYKAAQEHPEELSILFSHGILSNEQLASDFRASTGGTEFNASGNHYSINHCGYNLPIDYEILGEMGFDPFQCSWCAQPNVMKPIFYEA